MNCIASGSQDAARIALPATTAVYGVRSVTSAIGRTSTSAPLSVSVWPIASATPAVEPVRVA
jgi:hypothetical protein